MMFLVSCRQLCPNAGLPLGHDREEEPNCVNSLVKEIAGKVLCQFGVVEHDRHDRGVSFLQIETSLFEQAAPVPGVPLQFAVAPVIVAGALKVLDLISGATAFENR